jgi:glycosyltransferase involved in cell wall biosynthesis
MSDSQEGDFRRKWYVERVKRALFAQFDAYLVAGERHVAYARKLGAPEELIFTKYDVVDNEFWAARADEVRRNETEWRGRLNLPGHFFLTSSRLVEKKNVSGLLCAYRQYLSAASAGAWPLIIVGDGHLRSQLERERDELHLEGHVEFRGYLSAEELAPFYALASVFILASSHSEQWGLVVNEAMASGTPALVSDVCGCVPDLVREGVTGYSFAPDDEAGLARLLQSCSGGVFDLAAMGAAAAGRVSEYSPEAFARNALAASAAAMERSARRGRMRLLPRLTVSLVSATRS